jgi:spermidine synthase
MQPGNNHETDRFLLPTLVLLFFLTGISGLIYQVLWLRLLTLVFGVTVWAASTVLASFMAGLALGSFLAGRLVDRAHNPLRWYGIAEVLVGLTALATPLALNGVERLYVGLYGAVPDAAVSITVVRFLLAFAVLLVPTTLMGATLPIIIKSSLLRTQGLGERVSLLYATNTAGAVVGALLTGLYLIGSIGISASFHLAAGINILVGGVAIVASLTRVVSPVSADYGSLDNTQAPATEDAMSDAVPTRARQLVLFVFALSGFASLALEVIWVRVLVLFLDVATYAFTIMLATVLCGIAVGSYLITPLMRRRLDWVLLLAVIELAIATVAVLSLATLDHGYDLVGSVALLLQRPLLSLLALTLVTSFLAIFPTMLLFGVAFPIGVRLWAGDHGRASTHAGERIGLFYSVNLIGAILGSVAAGFLLLPWLGSQASLIAIGAISLISGLLLLTTLPPARRGRALSAAAIGVTLFVLASVTTPDPFSTVLARRYPGEKLLWREEGVQTTVTVQEQQDGVRVLHLDGLHQANDSSDMVHYHRMIGYLPLALHPNPRDVLVVGLGGGVTAGAISQYPGVNIDVVELSETVVDVADWFRAVNNDVIHQPNAHIHIDDGRNYLLLTPKHYDIIAADIIQPTTAGAGNLYSAEYFQLVRDALKDDGLVLQWIGIRGETDYKLIMRTFLSVFPDTTLWYNGSLMVGRKAPLELDPADFARKLQQPAMREILERMEIRSFQDLLAFNTAASPDLRAFVGPGAILTDDQPRLEYWLSLRRSTTQVDLSSLRGDARSLVRQ